MSDYYQERFKDDWRYVPSSDMRLQYVAQDYYGQLALDMEDEDEEDPGFAAYDLFEEALTPRQADIVTRILYDKEPYRLIGLDYGVSKQRIGQIYHQSLGILKKALLAQGLGR